MAKKKVTKYQVMCYKYLIASPKFSNSLMNPVVLAVPLSRFIVSTREIKIFNIFFPRQKFLTKYYTWYFMSLFLVLQVCGVMNQA